MPNLISLMTVDVATPLYPTRASGRTAAKNRRAMLKSAIWPLAKAAVILLGVFVREVFL